MHDLLSLEVDRAHLQEREAAADGQLYLFESREKELAAAQAVEEKERRIRQNLVLDAVKEKKLE